jgi:predicted transcriptional regulator
METYCDIILALGAGVEKPTHLLMKANLPWNVMQKYIDNLESQDLITTVDEEGRTAFRLTNKGFKLLRTFASIKDAIEATAGR